MPPIQIRKCYSPDDLCCNFFPLFTENLSSVTGAPKSGDMIQKERKGWGRLSTQPGSEATPEPGPWTCEGAGARELLRGQPWAFTGGLAHQQARPRSLCTVTPPPRTGASRTTTWLAGPLSRPRVQVRLATLTPAAVRACGQRPGDSANLSATVGCEHDWQAQL